MTEPTTSFAQLDPLTRAQVLAHELNHLLVERPDLVIELTPRGWELKE